jgi:transposase
VALEAIRGEKSINEIASRFKLHPTQVTQWKKQFLSSSSCVFEKNSGKERGEKDELIDELYRQIGVLKVELDWLKKKSDGFN